MDPPPPAPSARIAEGLLALSHALGAPRSVSDVLVLILEATTDLLDCDRASLLLYDAASRELRFVAATSEETAALAEIPVPLYGSLAGTIFREDRPVIAADVPGDPRHFAEPAEALDYQPRAIAGVPLRIDGAPVGVLEALDPHSRAFTDADLDVLEAVAAQAAVAIHTARQRHALDRAHSRLAEMDRLKSRLLELTGSALQGPLAAVDAAVESLRAHGAATEADRLVRAMRDVQKLLRSASEVGSHADATLPADHEPVVLQDVLRTAAHAVTSGPVVLDLPPAAVTVTAQPRRLALAFEHLLTSASRPDGDGRHDLDVGLAAAGRDAVVEIRSAAVDLDTLDVVIARVLLERDGVTLDVVEGALRVRMPLAAA